MQEIPSLLWAYASPVEPSSRHLMSMRIRRMTAWLIVRGSVTLIADEHSMDVNRGWWVFFCGSFQKHDFSTGAEVVSVSLRLPESMASVWQHRPFKIKADKNPELEKTARKLIQLINDDMGGDSVGPSLPNHRLSLEKAMMIASVGLEWAALYSECRRHAGFDIQIPEKQRHPVVSEAVAILTSRPLELGYSEIDLAQKVGLSPGHLEQLFVKELGVTPRRLWEQGRREQALRRMTHSDINLKQIAYELGFCNQAHFSSWFRKSFKCTPSQWRRIKRNSQ